MLSSPKGPISRTVSVPSFPDSSVSLHFHSQELFADNGVARKLLLREELL